MMSRNSRSIVTFAFALAALPFIATGFTLLTEHSVKADYAKRHGQSCLALVDPTVGKDTPERWLPLLRRADPQGAQYAAHHYVTVTLMDDATLYECAGHTKTLSDNPVDTNAVFLNSTRLTTLKEQAVALSHELVHVEHGDPSASEAHHSFWRHLWISEEGEAHLKSLETAKALEIEPLFPAWEEYLFDIYVLPIAYALTIAALASLAWTIRAPKTEKRAAGKDASPSLASAATR